MKNRTLFWTLVIFVLLGSFFLVSKLISSPGQDTSTVSDQEWIKGNPDSPVTLVEYSDFQCPGCAQHVDAVKSLEAEFGDHIQIVYRHFPLGQHQNAPIAAQSTEAAGQQGKFWEMHDMIFESQLDWNTLSTREAREMFQQFAVDLELDIEQFEDHRDASSTKKAVEADYDTGRAAGVNSTPTFFLNGEPINLLPSSNYEKARQKIRDAIRANQ